MVGERLPKRLLEAADRELVGGQDLLKVVLPEQEVEKNKNSTKLEKTDILRFFLRYY